MWENPKVNFNVKSYTNLYGSVKVAYTPPITHIWNKETRVKLSKLQDIECVSVG